MIASSAIAAMIPSQSALVMRMASERCSLAEEAGGTDDEGEERGADRDDLRPFDGDLEGDDRLAVAEQQRADDAAGDRAEPADDDDGKGLAQRQQAHARDHGLERRDEHAGGCRDAGREPHYDRVYAVGRDAHVLRG